LNHHGGGPAAIVPSAHAVPAPQPPTARTGLANGLRMLHALLVCEMNPLVRSPTETVAEPGTKFNGVIKLISNIQCILLVEIIKIH
jgi:hypothetical protein